MDKENFMIDLAAIEINTIVDNDAEKSLDNLLNIINKLLDKYAPLRKMTKKEFKQTRKPWITSGILKSIQRKNRLFNKYVKSKDKETKINLHEEYKILRNRINTLIYFSKKEYYSKYFDQYSTISKKSGKVSKVL